MPGFGLGSYLQGDMVFGITQSSIDGLTVFLIAGKSITGSHILGSVQADFGVAVILIITSRTMSWIMPFIHQGKYNKNLRETLNYNKFAYSIDPLIVPRQGGGAPALGLGFNVRY